MEVISLSCFQNKIGKKIGTSRWYVIDQERIDQFADVTLDHQFIHTDSERAAETFFGKTVAHGFLTLSMLSVMSYSAIPRVKGFKMSINYGFNRIRFVTPVSSGSRVRTHFSLVSSHIDKPGELTYVANFRVEIENKDQPALVGEWINRQLYDH